MRLVELEGFPDRARLLVSDNRKSYSQGYLSQGALLKFAKGWPVRPDIVDGVVQINAARLSLL